MKEPNEAANIHFRCFYFHVFVSIKRIKFVSTHLVGQYVNTVYRAARPIFHGGACSANIENGLKSKI